jgi:RNA 2',3'-cyclic 3'-phosphodiesterase
LRLFVAIDVPEDVKDATESSVVAVMRGLVEGARWSRPEGRHLTLKFLGAVEDERVADVVGAVQDVARRHDGFVASFDEVGGFPSLRRPRVLWLGLGEGEEEAVALAADLDRAMEGLGFARETRPFTGHLTLARFRVPRRLGAELDVEVPRNRFEVTEIVLFESRLHPKGARYHAVERFPLGGALGGSSKITKLLS